MKYKILMCISLLCIVTLSHAAFWEDMGSNLKTGSYYTFPDLTVVGDPSDRGFSVRFMFTRSVTSSDQIVLPALQSGWPVNAGSTQYTRIVNIAVPGATAALLQHFLRQGQIYIDPLKIGHDVKIE